jgi:hypothetical protein
LQFPRSGNFFFRTQIMEIDICPRWLFTKLRVPLEAQPHLGVLLSTLLALFISPVLIRLPHFCLMQTFLHIPCPGCGVLHSLNSVLHLEFRRAWYFNPGGVVFAISLVMQMFGRAMQLASEQHSEKLHAIYTVSSSTTLAILLAVWLERTIQIARR